MTKYQLIGALATIAFPTIAAAAPAAAPAPAPAPAAPMAPMAPMTPDRHQQMPKKDGCCPEKKDGAPTDDCCKGMKCCDGMKAAEKGAAATDAHRGSPRDPLSEGRRGNPAAPFFQTIKCARPHRGSAPEIDVTKFLLLATSALALIAATPAVAQHSGMNMSMPMPAPKKPAAKKPAAQKAAPKKAVAAKHKPVAKKTVRKVPVKAADAPPMVMDHGTMDMPMPAASETPPPVDHSQMDHSKMDMPMPSTTEPTAPVDHSQMNMPMPATSDASATDHSAMPGMDHGAGGHMNMVGAFGAYPSTREASGTSWQPDTSEHKGWMMSSGQWMFMVHGNLDLIADTQSGRRGDDKLFTAGMLMGMATRTFSNGNTLQFRGMVSPDPLMGKSGYPLLLASGETANGRDRLVDRQHPHDLFMELSASYSVKLAPKTSAFIYAGLPGEPAFGPPAFMHRQSISISPETPITHHWLDSTHITFGVVTGGLVFDRIKIEASRFNGREPDQYRYNIETGPLDSSSVRLSWNPTDRLSLQGSWAYLKSPEQLEPGVNQRRWSASASYTRPFANGWWASTAAWGRKTIEGRSYDAVALESSYKWDAWTMFGRAEWTQNNELVEPTREYQCRQGLARAGPRFPDCRASRIRSRRAGLAQRRAARARVRIWQPQPAWRDGVCPIEDPVRRTS